MKKYLLSIVMLLTVGSTFAQVTVAEPEFINSYCILTSDSTFATLPKESGSIGQHENKVRKFSKILGGAAQLAGAAGMVGIGTAGTSTGIINGVRTVTTAHGVASAADAVSGLAGASGTAGEAAQCNLPEEDPGDSLLRGLGCRRQGREHPAGGLSAGSPGV